MSDDAEAVAEVAAMSTLFTPWVVRLAVTYRLPDLVAGGCAGVAELAARSGTDPDALRRVLRHLVDLGLFTREGPDRVGLTARGRVLCGDHPAQLARFLDQANPWAERTDRAVPGLLESVRTGASAWPSVFGRPFWDDLAADAEFAKAFDEVMAVHAAVFGPAVARRWDWSGVTRLVDVGGGTGLVLAEVLRHHPHLRGVLVDLPGTAARARAALDASGVGDRAEVVGGSFFDPLPPGGDVYLLSNIIHDWADADGERILRRCAEAAGPGGVVLLAERVVDGGGDRAARAAVSRRDMAMLLLMGARERDEAEFRALGAAAGLRLTTTVPLLPEQGVHLLAFTAD
ncbi:methyltransferase [Actinosynnema sp. NPDC004786]